VGDTHLTFRKWRRNGAPPRHRSLWVDEALEREGTAESNRLRDHIQADVAIVGGGLTGLWTAIRLKEADPGISVVVLEADRCGTGASGRNSGALGHYWSRLPVLVRYFGEADAVRLVMASTEAVDDTHRFISANGIECQARRGPSVWSTNSRSQIGAWEGVFRMADKLGIAPPYRRLSPQDLKDYFGDGPYHSGVSDDNATRLQPALLSRGLRRVAVAHGVAIYEETPVLDISGDERTLTVRAANGTVVCSNVVLAANAWMAHLAEFRRHVMVLSSDVVVTDPIPERLEDLGMRQRPGGVNSRQMLNYGGLTPEGRVYLGRGGGTIAYGARIGPEFDFSQKQAAEVEADFRFLYPELKDVPIARSWAGPIDRSTTGLPHFGQLQSDRRIHYAIGYTGHGLGASNIGGHVIAAKILGKRTEWSDIGDILNRAHNGYYPPEPIRFVAGKIVRAAVLRKEMGERNGRKPCVLDAQLSKLALATIPGGKRFGHDSVK